MNGERVNSCVHGVGVVRGQSLQRINLYIRLNKS